MSGDIRVGLCFRDLGIKVEGIDGFVMDSFNVHPCKKPYIIGHFEEEEIRLLSDAIRSSPKKVTDTMGDIFQAMYRNTPRLRRQDIDRSGGDFADFPSADPQQCEDVCLTYKECMSWVHVSGKCLLKIGPMLTRRAEGFKSGAIVERYQCKKEKNK
ncbi:hypothetical protein HDU79_009028 [Rhizoclosmatium sp. JEL0117]|nr:hypothetical protein HDU79_009028 [Rhizoclosmatium sp. JEL0117]